MFTNLNENASHYVTFQVTSHGLVQGATWANSPVDAAKFLIINDVSPSGWMEDCVSVTTLAHSTVFEYCGDFILVAASAENRPLCASEKEALVRALAATITARRMDLEAKVLASVGA